MTQVNVEQLADTLVRALPASFHTTLDHWELIRERHVQLIREALGADSTVRAYPYKDGDATVLGPETLLSPAGDVINYRGTNFVDTERAFPGR